MPVNANISSAIDIRLPATPEQVDDMKAFREFQIVYAAIRSLHAALSGVTPDGTIPTEHNTLSGINDGDINHITDVEYGKLLGIEAGAQVNNISDIDATDLTDGGLTETHKHLSRTIGAETLPGVTYSGSDIIVDGTGVYWINTETYYTGEMTRITPAGATFTIATVETTYYLTADYNAGTPILACGTTYPDESDGTVALIAKIIRTGTTTFHTTWRDHLAVGLPNKIQKALEYILGPVATSGLVISDTGVRYLTISAGNISLGGIETPLAAIDTSGADTYRFIYYDGAAWQGSSITQLSNTQYQSITGLQSVTGSRYAINWIWRGIEDQKHAYVLLGEGDYSYAEAIDSSPPVPPAWITDHSALLGRILYQRNSNTAIVQQVSSLGYALVGAIQHNNTTNKQGGTTDEYYHLTEAEWTELTDGTVLKDADIGVTVQAYDADIPTQIVSQADAEAGTATDPRTWTAERVAQAITALTSATGISLANVRKVATLRV